jgi:ankyrin repeat protein
MQIGEEDEDEEEDVEDIPVAVPKEVDIIFADGNGETYLFKAVKAGDFEQVKAQIENGADVHRKTIRRETPLYAAVGVDNLEMVKYLLDHGAESDINEVTNWGFTPLREATNKNYLEIAELLKSKGAK